MTRAANLERHTLVERYRQDTLEVLSATEVADRLGERHAELVGLIETAFTVQRRMGRLVMPPEEVARDYVGIHPVLERDLTIPNHTRFIDTPFGADQPPVRDRVWHKAFDAVFGLYPRLLDRNDNVYARVLQSPITHRNLVTTLPSLQRVSGVYTAAVIAHEFDHIRTHRGLNKWGIELTLDDSQLVAGEKSAYEVSDIILDTDTSLPADLSFEAFWAVVRTATTPATAAWQASELIGRFAATHPNGYYLGELAAMIYAAKALSLLFGDEDGLPTADEIESYKLLGLVYTQK